MKLWAWWCKRSIEKVKYAGVDKKDQHYVMVQELESRHSRVQHVMETKLHRDFSCPDTLEGRSLETWLVAADKAVQNLVANRVCKTDCDLRQALLELIRKNSGLMATVKALQCRGSSFGHQELFDGLHDDGVRTGGEEWSGARSC